MKFERYRGNSVSPQFQISGDLIADAGWEAVMNKRIAVALLIVAVLLEPTMGHACTNNNVRPTYAENEKPTPLAGVSDLQEILSSTSAQSSVCRVRNDMK